MQVHHVVDGVFLKAPGHQDADGQRDTEHRQQRLDRLVADVAHDHAGGRRHQALQPEFLDQRRTIGGGRFRAHGLGRFQAHRGAHRGQRAQQAGDGGDQAGLGDTQRL